MLALAKIPAARVTALTYYPKRQTNLSAAELQNPSLFEPESLVDVLPKLQSGFYYLWLPQMKKD